MTPIETVISKLPGTKQSGKGWTAHCPAHEDRRASLSIAEGDDGRALLKCHAGCTVEAVASALELTMRDLMPAGNGATQTRNGKPKASSPTFPTAKAALNGKPKLSSRTFRTANAALVELERRHGKRAALWTYHDGNGEPVALVVRWNTPDGKKDIRPASRHVDGWRIGAMPGPRPLYQLPTLAGASRIVVVEGEKTADAARSLGVTATTSASGSQAPQKTDWRPLAGKEVWILPDNDAPGRKYAASVAAILAKLAPPPTVRIIDLPGLNEGEDLVEWIESHGDAAEPESIRKNLETLIGNVEPELPEPKDDSERFQPFPMDALPEPVRGFVATGARAIGCDPCYLALPLLVAIASAIGTTRRLELKRGWSAPAILWGALVGESGTAKTPAFKLVMRPLRERQRKAMERHAEESRRHETATAEWEKAFAEWKRTKNSAAEPPAKPEPPHAERFIVSDTTVEALAPILLHNARGLLMARDELAGWLGSFDRYAGKGGAGADSSNWLSTFSAESIIVDRKTGTPRTIHVAQAAVCVIGGIQPAILRRALGAEHRESGLAARLLLCYPPRKAKQWTEADIDPRAEAELARLVERLFELLPIMDEEGETRPLVVRLTPDAKAEWTRYFNAHAEEQADLTGELSAAWSKLEEYAARLALVLHYVSWAAGRVQDELHLDQETMKAGITLANWFKNESRRVYAMLDETEADQAERRLVEWIERRGGSATARDVQQGCRWLRESGAAEEALNQLSRAGSGSWRDSPPSTSGGRPTRVFELSTLSTSTEPR